LTIVFLGTMLGTPRVFVALMPVVMRGTWAKVKAVAPTLSDDLAILADRSLLADRSRALALPTFVIGGAKSPAFMRQTVEQLATRLPDARAVLLPGQGHDVAAAAKELSPILTEFFPERWR
jgi:pimeloyl-ACP methyl ester carboxylesterase